MSSFEFNKIFAAILVAGITAMLGGFIAEQLTHVHELEENAVEIEGGEVAGSGMQAEAKPDPILHLIATADIAQGEKLSKACAACHSFEKGGPAKVGPNLWGTVGGPKAHSGDFAYSDGLKGKGGNWDYISLNKFLWKPKAFISDTKMNYIGIKDAEKRAAMVAWLRTLADSPAALPSDGAIAAEQEELGQSEEEAVDEGAAADESENADAQPQEEAEPESH